MLICYTPINRKGSKSFAVNVSGKTLVVEWADIIEYLIDQYDKECEDNEET